MFKKKKFITITKMLNNSWFVKDMVEIYYLSLSLVLHSLVTVHESHLSHPHLSSGEQHAIDTVHTVHTLPNKDECISILLFLTCPPYIYKISILANLVHEHSTSYQLVSTNCYWISICLITLLEKEFDTKLIPVCVISH